MPKFKGCLLIMLPISFLLIYSPVNIQAEVQVVQNDEIRVVLKYNSNDAADAELDAIGAAADIKSELQKQIENMKEERKEGARHFTDFGGKQLSMTLIPGPDVNDPIGIKLPDINDPIGIKNNDDVIIADKVPEQDFTDNEAFKNKISK